MKWINVEEMKPPASLGIPDYSIEVLISDGKSISVGYFEFEYNATDPNESLQFSDEVWHDDASILAADHCGWPNVTHWAILPELPGEIEK